MAKSAANSVNLNLPEILVASNACVEPTPENLSGYSLFDLCFVLFYMNKQLCYYQITSAMLNADKKKFKAQINKYKTDLKLLNWNKNIFKIIF